MSNVPANLKYAASHEWMLLNADGTVTLSLIHISEPTRPY